MAEALLNNGAIGQGRFQAFSAGSHPKGAVHPMALETLRANHLPTDGYRSKSWEEFSGPGAPPLDFVITVCDQAAAEPCPIWPGQPMTAHWGIADPAAAQGSDDDKRRAFREAITHLRRRIDLLVSLPFEKLDRLSLQDRLRDIGRR